ncbi:major facilitator superfamily domain-containing protein [Aspergillus nidulans var. acristatus]
MTHWRVLAAVAAMNWGGFFIYDIPASLSTPLSMHLSLSDHQFAYLVSVLYTVYAIPNAVLPFLTGPAVQRFGERAVLLTITSSIILGQLLFAVAVHTRLELGMIAGRLLIGLGGEVVGVLGCEIITRWFQDKSLSLALAINLGAGRLGSVANTAITPQLIELYDVTSATWIATALSLGGVTLGATYLLTITKRRHDYSQVGNKDDPKFIIPLSFRQYPPSYWLLALICLLSYGCLNTFTNSAQRFLAKRYYHGDQRAAGSALSILFVLSGSFVPPFGLLLDCLSSTNHTRALITSNIFLLSAHAIFLTGVSTSPTLPLCLLGTADALFSVSFWASVVRCLLPLSLPTETHPHNTPLLKTEDGHTEQVYVSSTISDNPESAGEGFADEAGGPAVCHSDAVRTLGLGMMSSMLNTSTAVVPVALAVMENLAGLSGLEAVFLTLALAGFLATVRLAWI